MSLYKYGPLDPQGGTIRLMTLLPGSFDDDICVTLREYIFSDDNEEAPRYEALSYTWGSTEHPDYIRIVPEPGIRRLMEKRNVSRATMNKLSGRLAVTQNLAEALRYLRLRRNARVLWIDAVCVDQQNLKERGQQVERMGDIYRNSKQVIVWIGPAGDNSKLAFETFQYLSTQVEIDWLTEKINPSADADAHWADPDIPLPYDYETSSSIYSLLCRPWFKRLWIWQEVILAETVELQCGFQTLHWIALCKAMHCMCFKPLVSIGDEDSRAGFTTTLLHVHSLTSSHTAVRRNFQNLLDLTEDCEYTDPRDRIYALLHLINNTESVVGLKPDYTQTPRSVYQDLVLRYLNHEGELDLLVYCDLRGDFADKPTWVPDWSKHRVGRPFYNPTSCIGSTAKAEYIGNGVLRVTGLYCAEVNVVETDMLGGDAWPRIPDIDIIRFVQRLAEHTNLDVPYVDGSEMIGALCRTLCIDQFAELFDPPALEYPNLEASLKYLRNILRGRETQIEPYSAFLGSAWWCTKGKRFFTTREGHIGLATQAVEARDQVCVVLGCRSPLLLRGKQDGTHVVVGECYIHGLMKGEALLGQLPSEWQLRLIAEADVGHVAGFINRKTGDRVFEDPRLGQLPPDWRLQDQGKGADWSNWYVNDETGERLKWRHDPRMTAEGLADRGVPLREFLLE